MVPTPTTRDTPELRRDPIAGRWVILAPERGRRPGHARGSSSGAPDERRCPFCPGNERETPSEITARRPEGSPPDGPGWTTRVIPNKFAAVAPQGSAEPVPEEIYERMEGVGAHEVVIESPEHEKELSELPLEQVEDVLAVYRERAAALCRDARIRYALVFKNYGASAGASQEHSHTQILAMPVIPNVVAEELAGSRQRFEARGLCAFCEILAHERERGTRVVAEDDAFVAFTPYASRFPFETWIVPRRHASSFESAEPAEVRALARTLKEVLGRVRATLDRPCYNLLIHSAPCREPALDWYHWHVEVIPKLSTSSGFEWGTGAYINAMPPEEAALLLRRLEPAGRTAS